MARQGVGRKCWCKEASADLRCCHEKTLKGRAGCMDKIPLQEGRQELDVLPRKGKHKVDVPLQGIPNEGKNSGGHKAL